jgi:GNAT superfamily N-acetyltransferase
LEERIDVGQIFVFIKENNILGVGIIERSILQEGYASVGMFTNEDFRMQGIGRTIIHYLKEWCYSNNLTPISGCWYYNINSKLTLESAGMVTKTRLLNFQVRE